ncbi:heptaprenyl diphosphate synthase component 1 [Aneurinibacillus terranovensis]|uniref:heptaprenyl diphosphate synthase component 1 n=1 Tax=Aneurinibacillus terranovensis TaxID=278991 RepID=UPI0004089E82|nr:heptaprenyl diphosphate synthase component 1 [Aneurinibacillus terranovensis]
MNFVRSDFQEEISEIIGLIKRNAENSVLIQYVDNPAISPLRVCLLYFFLHQCGLAKDTIQRYIVTTMLIQLGLDTHDNVSVEKETTLSGIRSRQLTVLAGDYFSSLYYFLLAEMEDVSVIRSLADSIERINERKISLYQSRDLKAEDYLKAKVWIESELVRSFIESLADDRKAEWMEFVMQMHTIELLVTEYNAYKWNQPHGPYLMLLSHDEGTYHGYKMLIHRIHKALHHCRKLIGLLGSEELKSELKYLLDDYASVLDNLDARAEEM